VSLWSIRLWWAGVSDLSSKAVGLVPTGKSAALSLINNKRLFPWGPVLVFGHGAAGLGCR
jgi:hypothetical protein